MPTELELIALETEFDLYLSFTKRLVLNLPDSEDRTRAAIWLQKLRSINTDEQKKLRNEHLKLLLFALHRRSLLSVFEKPPHDELESFHDGLTLLEMTRELIELTEKKQASGDNSGESPLPPVTTNVSADLKEYCASQAIPKFGAHVYYAVSNEPIQMWSKSPNCVYPAASDVPNPLQWELTLSKLTDHVLEKQAEAERLAAEAAHDDKTEEKDNTQVLPMIDVAVCGGAGNSVFRWKADSILTLHQNYDFSDVGVAEDLEVQGKWQLELDEMAFSILDHSLPGRQKVVVRDPYYKGLPPDLAERRHHGVVDEVEVESTSSSDMESIIEERGHGISAMSAKQVKPDLFTGRYSNAGELAKKYLSSNADFLFGVHYEQGQFKVGNYPIEFDGDDIVIDYNGEKLKIKGTEGVWRLVTQDTSSLTDVQIYSDEDWIIYMELLLRSNQIFEEYKHEIAKFSSNGHGFGAPEQNERERKPVRCCCCGKKKGNRNPRWQNEHCGRPQHEIEPFFFGLGDLRDKAKEWMPGMPSMPNLKDKVAGWMPDMPSLPSFGLQWPKLSVGVPKLGLRMPSLPSLPNFGLPSLGFSLPDLRNLKFWEILEKRETFYLKALDYLVRRVLAIQTLKKAARVYCRATENCIIFWILEYLTALMGTENGVKKCIDWTVINEPLIVACDLFNLIVEKLHPDRAKFDKPVCDLRSKLEDVKCTPEEQNKYKEYIEAEDTKFEAEVKRGLEALKTAFNDDASYFEKARAYYTLSSIAVNTGLKTGLNYLINYFQGKS